VVDDDQAVLDALRTFLARAGFDAKTAAAGVEALRAGLHGLEVITADLDMRFRDGMSSSNGFTNFPRRFLS